MTRTMLMMSTRTAFNDAADETVHRRFRPQTCRRPGDYEDIDDKEDDLPLYINRDDLERSKTRGIRQKILNDPNALSYGMRFLT